MKSTAMYDKLDSMPSVDDAGESESPPEDKGENMDPELTMLAKEAGFTGDKAMALWQFVKACAKYNDDQGA